MKKIGFLLLIIVLTTFCITSCRYVMTNDESDFLGLNAYINIPCLTDDYLRDYRIHVLETDDYGRVLYSVDVKTKYSDIDAVVIMQDYDESSVMFYEDLSYYLGQKDDERIKALKESNDWNKELNYSKITKRNAYFSLNGDAFGVCFGVYPESIGYGYTYETDIKLKNALSADSLISTRTDYDENGKWLMYCLAEKNNKSEIIIAVYENSTYCGYEVIDDIANINNTTKKLKEKTNWNYNYCN